MRLVSLNIPFSLNMDSDLKVHQKLRSSNFELNIRVNLHKYFFYAIKLLIEFVKLTKVSHQGNTLSRRHWYLQYKGYTIFMRFVTFWLNFGFSMCWRKTNIFIFHSFLNSSIRYDSGSTVHWLKVGWLFNSTSQQLHNQS